MAKEPTKSSEKGTRSQKMRDLPPKALKARKTAAVKGGGKYLQITMSNPIITHVSMGGSGGSSTDDTQK